ncbi:MAG: DUF1016 N-terminal domain-containing protein [Ferruginibacter sp.]
MKKSNLPKKDNEFTETLGAIVKTIEQAQVKMVMAANTQLLWAYWNIGNELSFRTKTNAWGAKIIDTLSKDLRDRFPAIKVFQLETCYTCDSLQKHIQTLILYIYMHYGHW